MPNRPTALRPDIGSDVVNSRSRADAAFHNTASVRAADSDARDLGPVRRSGPVYDKAVSSKPLARRTLRVRVWAGVRRRGEVNLGHKEIPMTQLRQRVLEELERRNYSQATARAYVG